MNRKQHNQNGFSLVELVVVITIVLIALSLVANVFTTSLMVQERETQKSDALTSVQAALSVMSREISNSGFGMNSNGIVIDNSNSNKLHFRTNIVNDDHRTDDPGEEIVYFYDPDIDSIVRYDRFANPDTAVVINRVSNVTFQYQNFNGSSSTPTISSIPTEKTGKIKITLMVELQNVQGQPENQIVSLTTETALRNSNYMLNQY